MAYMKQTCVSIKCPFMGYCKHYNLSVGRNGGCEVQDKMVAAAKKVAAQRKRDLSVEIPKYRLVYTKRSPERIRSKFFFFDTFEEAKRFAMESYEWKNETHKFPDGKEADDRQTNVREDGIFIIDGACMYSWEISKEKIVITREQFMRSISCISISRPSILCGWKIHFNYGPEFALAPAEKFLTTFYEEIIPGYEKDWVLSDSYTPRNIGRKSFEYKGENPERDIDEAANKLAEVLGTRIVHIN